MRWVGGVVRLDRGQKQHFTRPAVNPLFTSAALTYGNRTVGVILTGGGSDGVQGLLDISAAGGLAIAQAPSEAESQSMPVHAISLDHVSAVLPLHQISDLLIRIRCTDPVLPAARA